MNFGTLTWRPLCRSFLDFEAGLSDDDDSLKEVRLRSILVPKATSGNP